MTLLHRLILLAVIVATVPACSLWPKVSGHEKHSQDQAQLLASTQQRCQRYADDYAGRVTEAVGTIKPKLSDATQVTQLLTLQLQQLNAAFTIATGPSPVVCQLDFVVLASLSRMVAEQALDEVDPSLISVLVKAYRELEHEAWKNAAIVLTPAQLDELRALIIAWREKNPDTKLVGFVHFSEFAQAAGWSKESNGNSASLFGLIGLDPLAGLDPAVRQIEQTRLLAERMIFYAQRTPYLLDVQMELVVARGTMAPEVKRANASLERASVAMTDYATLGAGLPDALARERQALIQQLSGEMLRQESELRGLLTESQATLQAGTDTAVAIDSAIAALDKLMVRFPKREPGTPSAGRPFDVTEYTAAATEMTGTARQLTQLLEALGRNGQPMSDAMAKGVDAGRGLVDYLFWRAALLGLLLIAGALAAALAFRKLAPRIVG